MRTILFVGVLPDLRTALLDAARAAWPRVDARECASVEEALAYDAGASREMLLLGADVDEAERLRARQALAVDGLPRWPVVIASRGVDTDAVWHLDVVSLSADEWAARLTAIAGQQETRRTAARASGDLCTIARRIGHELRSPLGCIITSAEVLREEFGENAGAVDALVQPILDSAAEMTRLITQLTLVARATAVPPRMAAVDVGLAVWKACERLTTRISAAGAEVIEPPLWPEASGVPEWVEQIWENLIENVLNHGGARPRMELGWERSGGQCRFFVRDFGPGVTHDERERLFRPFHLLHRTDSGRGIGLAIVQRLVDLQGGTCGFEPGIPQGACFFFTLPCADALEMPADS